MVRGAFLFGRYWGGQKWQKLKSILMITRVGFGRTELSLMLSCTEFCALSSGHGPRGRGFEGFCKTLDFHDFWESKMEKKHENAGWTWSDLGFRSSRPSQNDLLKNPEKNPGVFSLKKQNFKGIIEKVRARGGRKFPVHCGNSMNFPNKWPGPK